MGLTPRDNLERGTRDQGSTDWRIGLTRRKRTYIIADAGSNHCGRKELALELVREAGMAGADCVKFQLFKWNDVHLAPQTQDPKFELDPEWLPSLAQEAHDHEMDFACTPFAPWACDAARPYVRFWKIGSFEALRRDLFLATQDKVRVISLGRVSEKDRHHLMRIYTGDVFLHCVSNYPTSMSKTALWRLRKMMGHTPYYRRRYKEMAPIVGLSDHSAGWQVPLFAAGAGLKVLEKHLKLFNQMDSPDSGDWALEPDEFGWMVAHIHQLQDSFWLEEAVEQREYVGRKEHWGERCV